MKKKISILLTAAISFMLAACSLGPQNTAENNASSDGANPVSAESPSADGASSDKVSNKKTKISFALWDEVQKPVFDEIISAFEREHPDIDVDLVLTPWFEFVADYSEPAKNSLPYLYGIAGQYSDKLLVCKVDIEQNQDLIDLMELEYLPTYYVSKDYTLYQAATSFDPYANPSLFDNIDKILNQ